MLDTMDTTIFGFGCGNNQIQSNNSPSCSKALPVWKRLMEEKLNGLSTGRSVCVDDLVGGDDGFHARICRSCASALKRLGDLQSSCKRNMDSSLSKIMSSDRWEKVQCTSPLPRKRTRDSGTNETMSPTSQQHSLTSNDGANDVAVSGYHIQQNNHDDYYNYCRLL